MRAIVKAQWNCAFYAASSRARKAVVRVPVAEASRTLRWRGGAECCRAAQSRLTGPKSSSRAWIPPSWGTSNMLVSDDLLQLLGDRADAALRAK